MTRRPSILIGGFLVLSLVAIAVLAPTIAPYDPVEQNLLFRRSPPSSTYLLGTDIFGRDMLSRIMYGSRVSLLVGISSVMLGLVFGGACGMVAGYYGGAIDTVLMRFMDLLLTFPSLVLAMVVVVALGPNLANAMLAIGVWFAPNYARLARSATLSLRHSEFIESATSIGCGTPRILMRHILPNIISTLAVYSTLNIGTAFLMEAMLSFLGLGVQPPNPSWGAMVNEGRSYLQIAPHLVTVPGLAIMYAVAGFNLLGEGLRDLLDPRSSTEL